MNKFEIIIIGISAIIMLIIILFLMYDYFFHQKKFFYGRKYRQQNGGYSLDVYMLNSDPIKEKTWLRQKNSGIVPQLFKWKSKDIGYPIDTDVDVIVSRKGL